MMPVKKNKKSDKDAGTITENKKPGKETLPSPSNSKSPVGSTISSYFSPSSSAKQSLEAPKKAEQSTSSLPKDPVDVVDKQENTTTSTEKDSSQNSQAEEKHGEKSQQNSKTTASRQLLLSPKKDTNSGQKKKATKSRNKSNKKDETSKQPAITEHYPVRRSQRKCTSKIEEEKRKSVEIAILEGKEDGLEVRDVEGKGRGVFALKTFERGDFVCEYAGELIDFKTAKEREQKYSENKEVGCYMYYFAFGNKKYCVDGTSESGRIGRLLNHSVSGNCTTKVISVKDHPYLILNAAKHIKPGEELLYDYGERNKDAIASHPWLQL